MSPSNNGDWKRHNEDNARFRAHLASPRNGLTNIVDNNPDVFLAASLQFLHRLLAERTSHCGGLDKVEERLENQQIDKILEYERLMKCMENFCSSIRLAQDGAQRRKIFAYDSSDSLAQSSSIPITSDYQSEFLNLRKEVPVISGIAQGEKRDHRTDDTAGLCGSTARKTQPDEAGDFCHAQFLPTCCTKGRANGVRGSTSYADMVRSAISGLARNCGKKYKRGMKNCTILSASGSVDTLENHGRMGCGLAPDKAEYERKARVETPLSGRCSESRTEVPLRVQLEMEEDENPRKAVTLLVKIPNTVYNVLNRKISKSTTKIQINDGPGVQAKSRKKRLASVFRNLLKRRRTLSSSTVSSTTEMSSSHVSVAGHPEGPNFNLAETRENDTSCNQPKKCLKDVFEPQDEKGMGISQRDVEVFLMLAAEKRKTRGQHRNFVIPVEIRTTVVPLLLRKTRWNAGFEEDPVFVKGTNPSPHYVVPNGDRAEEFLQMLVGTLPENSSYFPTSKDLGTSCRELQGLPSIRYSNQTGPHPNDLQTQKNGENSALGFLLHHIATGAENSCGKHLVEKDTTVQTAVPKRQSSKISVCSYSSESTSASDLHESPDGRYDSASSPPATSSSSCGAKMEENSSRERTTEIVIEENSCSVIGAEMKAQVVADSCERTWLSVRDTGKTLLCHPVLSNEICGERKRLADAMIRWWGPRINYSTTPSSQTQLSAYSVSINNFP